MFRYLEAGESNLARDAREGMKAGCQAGKIFTRDPWQGKKMGDYRLEF
jgi:hypothetical protein